MSLKDVIGHGRQRSVLRGVLRHRAAGPAYLFTGPPGVGKRTTALEFARALLCRTSAEDSCGRCESCLQVGREGHPDCYFVAPEKKVLKIDQVRKVQQFCALTPAWGEGKAVLLDDAEGLNLEAANALLKTLEEPPPGVTMILVCSNLSALPPTVVSRCQKLSFGYLEEDEVEQVLRAQGLSPAEAAAAAPLTEGSPGQMLYLEDEAWKKPLAGLEKMAKAVSEGNKSAVLASAEGLAGDRAGVEIMVKVLMRRVRREMRRRIGLDDGSGTDRWPVLEKASEGQLLWLTERLVATFRLLGGNVNVKLLLGTFFTDWIDEYCGEGSA